MAAAEGNHFVKRMKRFTERQGEGFAMLALKSADAEADRAAFEKTGVGAGPVARFAREAELPDGTTHEVGFAIAFAEAAAAPDASIFVCQHLAEDVLYQPGWLEHANGAKGVVAVAAVAENPADFHILLSGAAGERELRSTSFGIEVEGGGQSIMVLTPAGFSARYGVKPPDPRRGLLFAAAEIAVADLDVAARHAGPSAKRQEGSVVVPAAPGLSTVIAFRSAENG